VLIDQVGDLIDVVGRETEGLMDLKGACVEPGCNADGVVGLQGAWLCLEHFDQRLKAMKAALAPALNAWTKRTD
jgi:hypothetical protein